MTLFHVCCADCLLRSGTDGAVVFFYNPNIHPRAEYQSRLKAVKQVCVEKDWKLVVPDWRPREYFENIANTRGRCKKCWVLRLEKTAEYAKRNGFEFFSTTLLSSRYQDRETIIEIGKKMGRKYGVVFLVPERIDFNLRTSGFYKQFFCGCVYSLKERFEEKYRAIPKFRQG